MIKKTLELFSRITLPQAIVVVSLIAGGVILALTLPEERWTAMVRIAVIALSGGGAFGTLFLDSRPSSDMVSVPPPAPPPVPRKRNGGFATIDFLLVMIVIIGAFVILPLIQGCGTAASIAVAAKPILDTTCAGARVACRLIDSACSTYESVTSGGDDGAE